MSLSGLDVRQVADVYTPLFLLRFLAKTKVLTGGLAVLESTRRSFD
jgi:hypothetical protein